MGIKQAWIHGAKEVIGAIPNIDTEARQAFFDVLDKCPEVALEFGEVTGKYSLLLAICKGFERDLKGV